MINTIRSFIASIIAVVMLILLTACGSDNGIELSSRFFTSAESCSYMESCLDNAFNCIVRPDRLARLSDEARTGMLNGIMDLSYVHGFHIQLFWDHFEPSNNTYVTDVIDECIEAATAKGKSVSLAFVHLWHSPQCFMTF